MYHGTCARGNPSCGAWPETDNDYHRHRKPADSVVPALPTRSNTLGGAMRKLCHLWAILFVFVALGAAQDRVFDWVRASTEVAQLDPADWHAGRVYHPAEHGGNMHIDIQAKLPVTVALAPNDQWNAMLQHPEMPPRLEFLCLRDHVVTTTYECHLPNDRPMVLLVRDERTPGRERAVMQNIGAVLGVELLRKFVSP